MYKYLFIPNVCYIYLYTKIIFYIFLFKYFLNLNFHYENLIEEKKEKVVFTQEPANHDVKIPTNNGKNFFSIDLWIKIIVILFLSYRNS